MSEVRVAIVGVGNCASSLVQGVEYYRNAREGDMIPGIMHVNIGPYHISDIKFVAAFDADASKVGTDLSEAIFSEPNNTFRFSEVPGLGVEVKRGPTLDGMGRYYRETVTESSAPVVEVASTLADCGADVLINYLPVGSEDATRFYVREALEAGCGVVNCIPVFIANEEIWQGKFRKAGVPIVGDDIKSQVGATIVHRVLAKLFNDRGVVLERTSQLNIGGNMDFKNMLERDRLESKKISKTNAVVSQLDHHIESGCVHIGPSDYVSWLTDRKWAYIRCEGRTFGDVPLNLEFKLEVWDSPNSAGIVIDALRCCKLAMDRGMSGALMGPAAYFMKSPPVQFADDVARDMVEKFIAGDEEGLMTTAEMGNGKELEQIQDTVND
ncbi:MAG: inositol-3-phosphate synthase [Actinobacteria bacterium]|nr:inositol-3-phosphate synthase [Actinomycetota bacterium]MBU1942194.1 inositol-3-phosphate synthase [Actinomycetota bacterium]MBU2688041.1 inositol-3-phosphate synthase [Actinomycetota bacterium]